MVNPVLHQLLPNTRTMNGLILEISNKLDTHMVRSHLVRGQWYLEDLRLMDREYLQGKRKNVNKTIF